MLVNVRGNIDRYSRPAPLENKDTINEVKYSRMSLTACGSIDQGHERFILVMTLEDMEEDKRFFMCLAALLCE